VDEIDSDDPLGLVEQELSPGGAGSARCWVDAGGVQDVPDGGGADAVAEPGQFAVDSSVAPPWILLGQLPDEVLDRRACHGAPGGSAAGGVVPFGGDDPAVPGQ